MFILESEKSTRAIFARPASRRWRSFHTGSGIGCRPTAPSQHIAAERRDNHEKSHAELSEYTARIFRLLSGDISLLIPTTPLSPA